MDEADILGDKIAIMAKGRLRAIGKSIRLKNKFGSGYRLSIIVKNLAGQLDKLQAQFQEKCPQVVFEEREYVGRASDPSSSELCRIVLCCEHLQDMKILVSHLEDICAQSNDQPIVSYGLSQTTLEDVFLKTVRGIE